MTADDAKIGLLRAPAPENLHPIVDQAFQKLKKVKPDSQGFLDLPRGKWLAIKISPQLLQRAVQLMDTLFKAAEHRGRKVGLRVGEQGGAVIEVGGEPVGVRLEEETDRVKHVVTPADQARAKRDPWFKIPEFDQVPSGRIMFVIDNASGGRRKWAEGTRWKQEQRIEKLLTGIETAAAAIKQERLEWERRQKEWDEEKRLREEAARLEAEEKAGAEQLSGQVYRWQFAKDIRELVTEMRTVVATADGSDETAKNRRRLAEVGC